MSPGTLTKCWHVVREIAGHSDIKVTMMVYAHGNVTEKAAALAQPGQAISGGLMSPADVSEAAMAVPGPLPTP